MWGGTFGVKRMEKKREYGNGSPSFGMTIHRFEFRRPMQKIFLHTRNKAFQLIRSYGSDGRRETVVREEIGTAKIQNSVEIPLLEPFLPICW